MELLTNEHHIVRHQNRRLWEAYPEAQKLYEDPQLKVRLDLGYHALINERCSPVPVPSYPSLMGVIKRFHQFEPTAHPIEAIEHLFEAVSDTKQHPRNRMGERALLELFESTIAEQIPYIEEGMVLG